MSCWEHEECDKPRGHVGPHSYDPTTADQPRPDYVTRGELVKALTKAGADTDTDALSYAGRILERAEKARRP